MGKARFRTESGLSESKATKYLEWLFYFGCGKKYLGWNFGTWTIEEDGTEKPSKPPGPRVWSVPDDPTERLRWNSTWLHLKGCHRGVCRGHGERCLPFITVDLDRHNGKVLAKDHYSAVMNTARLLKKQFSFLTWSVEVNPRNGSTKFFGLLGRPIPVEYAKQLGQQIHQSLIANGIGPREVFPYNSPQVFLPMREGKLTIIDTGLLGKAERRRTNRKGIRERFETYSAIEFIKWLRRGKSFDEATLERTLISACLQLSDQPAAVVPKVVEPASTPIRRAIKAVSSPARLRDEPDSFARQRKALMEFCRRNKRVVSVDEALAFIRANHLFSGSWNQNRAKRRLRVGQILAFIAKTFDSSLCTGVRHEITFGKYDAWAKRHCPDGWRRGVRRGLDEYGNIVVRERSRTVADWQFVSVFLSIAEYVILHDQNEDHSVPSARVESLWSLLHEQGVVPIPFCPRKWKITRDKVERLGVLRIDHHYHRGRAMKWWAAKWFPGLGQWKTEKAEGLLEAVPLTEFLKEKREIEEVLHNTLLQHTVHNNEDYGLICGSGADPPASLTSLDY